MEFHFNVLYPSLLPLEKPAMDAVLGNIARSYTPRQWNDVVLQHFDPTRPYVVTSVSHYKTRQLLPDFQHEYVTMTVQPLSGPNASSTRVDVFRTIQNNSLPARMGLWGPADDSVTVVGPNNQTNNDSCLYHLSWNPNQAPTLRSISQLIYHVTTEMPRYRLLRTSCYAYALAITRTIYNVFDGAGGAQPAPCFTRESYFLGCIPAGIGEALEVARRSDVVYRIYR